MSHPTLSREEVLDRLMQVFRDYGYDGASLSRIADATGLGRSSLYHYFPKGKDDMAAAVLAHAGEFVRDNVLAPLNADGTPRERLVKLAQGLDALYASGRSACLTNVLTMGDAAGKFTPPLRERLRRLIGALAKVAQEGGVDEGAARQQAEDVVIALHGALVVGRVLNSTAPFRRMLAELPDRLLAGGKT